MRVVVTGANGQTGRELAISLLPLGEVFALNRQQADLSRPDTLPQIIKDINPAVIVNAAAYTAVDKAESEERLATVINADSPGVLANIAKSLGALLIHYSTDYVFDGKKSGAYNENDTANPLNEYGRSKLAGDSAIHESRCDHIILRTTWVYSNHGTNFLNTMLKLGAERDELKIVSDQSGAPTWSRNIADATVSIISLSQHERRNKTFKSGLYNLTATGKTSWCGFATRIFEIASKLESAKTQIPRIIPITTADYPTPAKRPANSLLSGDAILKRFGIQMPNWDRALELCLRDRFEN